MVQEKQFAGIRQNTKMKKAFAVRLPMNRQAIGIDFSAVSS